MKLKHLALSLLISSAVYAGASFGGEKDMDFAKKAWTKMEQLHLAGESSFSSRPYKGMMPHGTILELLETRTIIDGIEGDLIVKRNYGGEGLSIKDVINNRKKYLKAITIMFKREKDYDKENKNWFYVKYAPNGNVMKNPKNMALAGKVAKGMPTGCIACHRGAEGGDYVFAHDRFK